MTEMSAVGRIWQASRMPGVAPIRASAPASAPDGCGRRSSPFVTSTRQVVQRALPPQTDAWGMPFSRSVSSTVAPGNSVGQLTLTTSGTGNTVFAPSGAYEWEISDIDDGNGVGWDHLQLSSLTITATNAAKFVIKVVSPGGVPPTGFQQQPPHPPGNYEWTVATSGTAITGFDESKFDIDASNFVGAHPQANFRVFLANSDKELRISYVPEPSGAVVALAGALAMLRRKR